MAEDESRVFDGEHAASDVIDVAAAKLALIAHEAICGGAAPAFAPHVRRSEPERFQKHESGILDPLMIVGDREVADVIHFPRGHDASAGLDQGSQPFLISRS
jgi:hypothetical protein